MIFYFFYGMLRAYFSLKLTFWKKLLKFKKKGWVIRVFAFKRNSSVHVFKMLIFYVKFIVALMLNFFF